MTSSEPCSQQELREYMWLVLWIPLILLIWVFAINAKRYIEQILQRLEDLNTSLGSLKHIEKNLQTLNTLSEEAFFPFSRWHNLEVLKKESEGYPGKIFDLYPQIEALQKKHTELLNKNASQELKDAIHQYFTLKIEQVRAEEKYNFCVGENFAVSSGKKTIDQAEKDYRTLSEEGRSRTEQRIKEIYQKWLEGKSSREIQDYLYF